MNASRALIRFFASRLFFVGTLVIFALQSVWIALTAIYPMAFDENFHLGIIQVYANKWSPFLTDNDQPAAPGPLGELIHDPSYLFHYVMSFPYRLVDGLFHSQTVDIIVLRLIGIALFVGSLVLFRKLLFALGASRPLAHVAIFLTTFIPVVPFLAAQINYDNLIVLLTPLFLLVTIRIIRQLQEGRFDFRQLTAFIVIALLASLTKYAFLPIVAASALTIIIVWLRSPQRRHVWHSLTTSFRHLSLLLKIGLIASLVLSLGLFAQRYFYNLAEYHSIQPDCADVLTIEQCKQYGPWGRDYEYKQIKLSNSIHVDPNPIIYMGNWLYGMTHRLYFTINTNFVSHDGLPLPTITGVVVCSIGAILFLIFVRSILRRYPLLWLILLVSGLYLISLIADEYVSYLHTNVYVAINGRYLIPFMPLLIMLIGFGWQAGIRRFAANRQLQLKAWLTVAVILLTLNGGGALSYLYYAVPHSWYWPNDPLTPLNSWLHTVARRLIVP